MPNGEERSVRGLRDREHGEGGVPVDRPPEAHLEVAVHVERLDESIEQRDALRVAAEARQEARVGASAATSSLGRGKTLGMLRRSPGSGQAGPSS